MESRAASVADDVDIIDTEEEEFEAIAAYYAEADKSRDREVKCVLSQPVPACALWVSGVPWRKTIGTFPTFQA